MKNKLRIIFMGTPDFAVPSLEALVEHKFNVLAVITSPDRASGRGLKIHKSAVKIAAEKLGLKVLQPTNLKSEEFNEELKSLNANLQIVVAFRMLPEVVWNMPEYGTFNLHASLLPNYRGAAPINWAVINGEKETGCTTFFLKHEIDTGNIILQEKEIIEETDTAGSLYARLMQKGAKLIVKTVGMIQNDEEKTSTQELSELDRKAPKIFKEDCTIDWNQKTAEVYNFIRGLAPYPAAKTKLNDVGIKVFWAEKEIYKHSETPGTYLTDNKNELSFFTIDGKIILKDVQLDNKKRMTVSDLLKGYKV
jgi:methionyl-tRNA formyltransferase